MRWSTTWRGHGALALAAAILLAVAAPARPGAAAAQSRPVVVELFTSQGCSSCPPADALLAELAARPDVLALSLHVDYWDYIGWRDPFGSPMNTERQRRYAEALGLPYVFTPQIVVDGRQSVVGSRRAEVLDAVAQAAAGSAGPDIRFVGADGGRVAIGAGAAPAVGATVWLAVFDREHETPVKRGENAGRTLRNAHVVREFERLGTWTGQALEFPLDLAAAARRGRYACAVIVQEGHYGPVLGAAEMDLDRLER